MKKEKKIVYGIEIVKPWSSEMYAHNEMVADVVRQQVSAMWEAALNDFEDTLGEEFMSDTEWAVLATAKMKEIQRAITACGFGYGYSVAEVAHVIDGELENAPLYRLNEIAEDLELDLKVGFVGFS